MEIINSLVLLLPALLGLVVPFLTELVSKSTASDQLKSVIAITFSVLAGAIPTVAVDVLSQGVGGVVPYLIAIAVAWITAGRMYLTGFVSTLKVATADTGIGDPYSESKHPGRHEAP